MADTSQAEQPAQTNGFADDGLDEDERGKMRPADIDADVREMERRKRVEMIMNSRLFREELERIFEMQMKEGGAGPGGLLQQLSDMMGHGGPRSNVFRSSTCVIPINDIRGLEAMGYAKGEKVLRCKLASVYRLMDLYGWTQGIHNHITARLNQDEEHFLVNPWGMLYHEITASSLVKVDMQGNVVEKGTTNYGVNKDSFQLHSAIHAARPDIKCIIHIHTNSVLAVSSLKCGLLPVCQESLVIGEVSSHQYQGGLFEPEERDKISRNLGPNNKVMFLTNHGAMCCGETVEEAFFNVYNTVQACESQVKLMPMGMDNLVLLTDEARKRVYDAARRPPDGFGLDKTDREKDKEVTSPTIAAKGKRWGVGCTEFEALMRMLDNAGFRTGYIYRYPLVKGDPPRPRNDVEVPPAVSSLGYLLEEEEMYRQGGWKKWIEGRKTHDRTRWLNSPNVYQKVEILETGTPDPKKITKWVADGSPTHSSTPVKIDTLQFVPKNTNPKEFKRLQQQIKENRRADKITSGPQSHILEGVSWEEAKKLQDANISQTGDQVILVGAASKGIIQRGFQHNAMVYKAPYAKNPFDTVTDDELEEYKKVVQRKARGEGYDEDQSESEALSSSAAGRPPTGKFPTSPTSDDESRDDSDYPDAHVERSKSARFPQKATPDLVVAPGGFGRSWSLGRNKRQSKDCSGKKVVNGFVRCSLQNSVAALPRPPHFHHASFTTVPGRQSTRAVPCVVPCSITRYRQTRSRCPGIPERVCSSIVSKHQSPVGIRVENVRDDDGDSLADVASIPSSDASCMDENHNVTDNPFEIKAVTVQLKNTNELQSAVMRARNAQNVTRFEQAKSYDMQSLSNSFNSETILPLETCDVTVIQMVIDECSPPSSVLMKTISDKEELMPSPENNCTTVQSPNSSMLQENILSISDVTAGPKEDLMDVDESSEMTESHGTSDNEFAEVVSLSSDNVYGSIIDSSLMENCLVSSRKTKARLYSSDTEDCYLSLSKSSIRGEKYFDFHDPGMGNVEEVKIFRVLSETCVCPTKNLFHYDVNAVEHACRLRKEAPEISRVSCSDLKMTDVLDGVPKELVKNNLKQRSSLSKQDDCDDDYEIPNGAGETLYDLSESCTEEFCSPFSTFSQIAYTSDGGEELSSHRFPEMQYSEEESESLFITDDEEVEIDCEKFSMNPVLHSPLVSNDTNPYSTRIDDSRHEAPMVISDGFNRIEERCPSFIAFANLPKVDIFEQESDDQNMSSDSESLNDVGAGYTKKFRSMQLIKKFSSSTPNMNSVGMNQGSPLELGRLFTLKFVRSCSEAALFKS